MNGIELIERKSIFENHKIISSEIAKIQNALFDNDIYSSIEDADEQMEYKNKFDAMEYKKYSFKYDIKILTAEYYDIKTYSKILYELLLKLFNEIDVNDFFVLLDLKNNFFESLFNKYRPLIKSYKRLEKITGKKYYDEAFYSNELSEEIIDIIFWLSRCSPQMNSIIIFDKIERYYLNICQYGNIHFTGLDGNNVSEDIIKEIGLKIIEGKEEDNFTNNGRINGRRIKI
jgi:hypothetical protein